MSNEHPPKAGSLWARLFGMERDPFADDAKPADPFDDAPLPEPPLVRPRARIEPAAGRLRPLRSQPPAIRDAAPSALQLAPPLVESSKSTRSITRSTTWNVWACVLSRRRDMPTCSWSPAR